MTDPRVPELTPAPPADRLLPGMPAASTPDLTRRTARGIGWSATAKFAQQIAQFGLSLYLMRVLGPRVYGLVGMVLVFSGFAAVFSELGFSSAIVQRKQLTELHRSSIFWTVLAAGVAIAAILALSAPLIAAFYHQAVLAPIVRWTALGFVLGAPAAVPRAILQRRMSFRRLAQVDIAALAVSAIVAIVAAVQGAGVWTLVAQELAATAASSAFALALAGWRPRLTLSLGAVRDVAAYGGGLTGFNAVNYWARSADDLLVARFLGPVALGFYSRAYALMLLPITQVVAVAAPAMFPALASIQDDRARVRRAYLRAMRVITFVTFPLMLGLVSVAPQFVLGLFGAAWQPVAPLIEILAFVGVTQSLCNPVGWIYLSQGRTDWMLWWGFAGSGTLIASIVVGVLWGGTREVAIAYLVGNLVITYPCIAIPGRLIGMKVGDVARVVAGNLGCAAAMAGVVWLVATTTVGFGPRVQLAILVPLGGVVYLILAAITRQPGLFELIGAIRSVGRSPMSDDERGAECVV
jgi:PST family polysaccharide transporter